MYSERILIEKLKEKLNPQFKKIWIHRKISASSKFKKYIESELQYVPILQPEFDMVFKCHNGDLNAIEVKYLTFKEKGYNLPYYLGLGQTLALQRFGFDHVGLWLFVDETVHDNILHKYGSEAWSFVRNEIKLDIEYSYFKIIKTNNDVKFMVMKFTEPHKGHELREIYDPLFMITWKHPNPLRNDTKAKKLRTGIELFLEDKL